MFELVLTFAKYYTAYFQIGPKNLKFKETNIYGEFANRFNKGTSNDSAQDLHHKNPGDYFCTIIFLNKMIKHSNYIYKHF